MKQIYLLLLVLFSSLSNYCESSPTIFYKIQKDTATSKLYLELGIEKYEDNNYKLALSYFEEAIKNDEDNWKAYRYKGDVEFELKKYQESIEDYNKALSINKSDTLSYIGRAESYNMTNNYLEAMKDYTIANQMGSDDVVIYFQRGYCYYVSKRYKEAIEDFTKAIKILSQEQGDYEKHILNLTYFRRGSANLDYGKYRDALNDINKYLSLGGKDPYNAYSQRGRAYMYLSQTDSALIEFNTIQKKLPNNAVVYKYLAMTYGFRKDSSNLRKNFKQSILLNPNDPDTYYYWASAELEYGNYSKVVELLETALKKFETEPSFDVFYRLGWAKAGTRDTLGAVTAFNKAVVKDSNRYELYEIRTKFLASDSRYNDQVLKDYTYMIRLVGDTSVVTSSLLYELRSFIKFSSLDTLGARADINKAIELLPTEPIYYVVRAAFNFYLTDDKELLLKDLDKAISLDSSTWEAHMWKVAVYERYKINNKYIDSDHLKACENLKKGIKNGAKVSTVVENYICKGKLPKDGKIPDMFFVLVPKFKNQGLKDNKMKK